jgi:hypothetical protein
LQRCWFTLAWKVEPSDDQPSCPVFFLLAKFQFSPKGEVKKFKNKKMKWIFEFDLPESEKNSLKSSKITRFVFRIWFIAKVWPNLLSDDCHFGNIKKFLKKARNTLQDIFWNWPQRFLKKQRTAQHWNFCIRFWILLKKSRTSFLRSMFFS